MRSYEFSYGPKLVSGPGSTGRLGELLPAGRCLFVTDSQLIELGLPAASLDALRAAGIDPAVFDAVEADPSRATLMAAVQAGEGCTSVVGFGGGSPMDVAKLAAYLLGSGEELDGIWGVGQANGPRLPLVLIPTTAGTGSEATPVAIITVGEKEKRGVSSAALVADFALLDAELTIGLPKSITAATGIDAMVHAIEAYTSLRLKNPMSDLLAREALRLLDTAIIRACAVPDDLDARGAMLLGAHLAGVAFANAPVAGVHALAYPLGGHFHVPHGLSNALMLGPVLNHNMQAAMAEYAELGCLLEPRLAAEGVQGRARGFVSHLTNLCQAVGLPSSLKDVGVTDADLPMLAREAMKQERLLINNPCPIREEDALRLYEVAL